MQILETKGFFKHHENVNETSIINKKITFIILHY